MDNKKIDMYNLMEENFKDEARSLKFVRNLGKELIGKIKIIDEEIRNINPERKRWKELNELDNKQLSILYQLRNKYMSQVDVLAVILNKKDTYKLGKVTATL